MKNRQSILVVDDDPGILRLLEKTFRGDYKVYTGKDAVDGFSLAHEHPVGLIILDAVMPGTDGYQLAAMLRESRVTRNIPMLMVTGYAGFEAEVESSEVGIDGFIEKPFDLAELKDRVAELFGRIGCA